MYNKRKIQRVSHHAYNCLNKVSEIMFIEEHCCPYMFQPIRTYKYKSEHLQANSVCPKKCEHLNTFLWMEILINIILPPNLFVYFLWEWQFGTSLGKSFNIFSINIHLITHHWKGLWHPWPKWQHVKVRQYWLINFDSLPLKPGMS